MLLPSSMVGRCGVRGLRTAAFNQFRQDIESPRPSRADAQLAGEEECLEVHDREGGPPMPNELGVGLRRLYD